MSTAPIPRPGILGITPYVGGESKAPGAKRLIKLSSNEGALGPSPAAIEALRASATDMHRYPEGGATALREALAERWGLEADRIVCGAGSDELIALLIKAYAGPGDELLYSRHGFSIYPIAARGAGATPVAAPETDFTANVDALLALVTPATKLVFIANPNNPTGTYLPASEIRRLHAALPPHVVLGLDAAYAEYVDAADYEPGIALVREAENVVMLRTFSKVYALGGLRLGWAYCPPSIADVLNRLRGPFNVSAMAQSVGIAALGDSAFMERCLAHNREWLPWTRAALLDLGLEMPPSVGNFLLVRFPDEPGRNADTAFDHLKADGIITRKMGSYHLGHSLRITIGTGEEMQALVDSLAAFMNAE